MVGEVHPNAPPPAPSNKRHATVDNQELWDQMDLDLGAVRAFLVVAQLRHFGDAADRLGVSQQAVSKRIARLEAELGAALFRRTPAGADLTEDGIEFLPHARAVIGAADQAVGALRHRRRALRVDVLDNRLASIELLRAFHESVGGAGTGTGSEIDIVSSNGLRSAVPALVAGTIDAAYARVVGTIDKQVAHTPVHAEPLHLLAGRRHPFADRRSVTAAELHGVTAWMPANVPGSEWSDFYTELAAEFGVRIEARGPNFGYDYLLEEMAGTDDRITFLGEGTRMPWHPDVVRMPITAPRPAYPWSLLWRRDARHPLLRPLIAHSTARYRPPAPDIWIPRVDHDLAAEARPGTAPTA